MAFDGECALCGWAVGFIAARDPRQRFRFVAADTPLGRRVLEQHAVAFVGGASAVVLIEGTRVFTRSTAALRIARSLSGPWPVAAMLLLVPRPLRDAVYDWVARHRYRWFGRRDACDLPSADVRARLL